VLVVGRAGVRLQIGRIDVLPGAGASPDGRDVCGGRFGTHADAAIDNGNIAAAEHPLGGTALRLAGWRKKMTFFT
jgi:hypothetical protein